MRSQPVEVVNEENQVRLFRSRFRIQSTALMVVLSWGLMIASTSLADENFFVAPITTELHKQYITSDETLYAVVNCSQSLKGKTVDVAELGLIPFQKELKKYALQGHTSLKLVIRFESFDRNEEAEAYLDQGLSELCESVGFTTVNSTMIWTSMKWGEQYGPILGYDEPSDATEKRLHDPQVYAFPIRTQLSKFLFGDFDCIVELRHPIDTGMTDIRPEVRTSIREQVDRLHLSTKEGILFKLHCSLRGQQTIYKVFGTLNETPGSAFAKELGFARMSTTISPAGANNQELLIGKPTPNFELPTIEGNLVHLNELRGDQPAIIAFWENDDPVSKNQASELAKLYDNYHAKGLEMVGVNLSDDKNRLIVPRSEQNSLIFPTLFVGRSVAEGTYRTRSFPILFFVNSSGIVEDYFIGHETGDEQWIEQQIKKLLVE